MISEVTMPYGEYLGVPVKDVPAKYLLRLWETQFSRTPPHKLTLVGKYIKDNMDRLNKESKKK